MDIIIERYSGYDKTYLIWDLVKNQMSLDSDKIKYMKRNNIFLDECEILYGPVGGKESSDFLSFDRYGRPVDKTVQNMSVFCKYMEDKSNNTEEKTPIRNIGFVMLSYDIVKDLESIVSE